jgi:hypothetical protein
VRSKTTRRFRQLLAALPDPVQHQAQEAYALFRTDPYHPSLHFKRISPSDPTLYSVRVGLRYRAIGTWTPDYMLWVWIGSHAEYDKLIERW